MYSGDISNNNLSFISSRMSSSCCESYKYELHDLQLSLRSKTQKEESLKKQIEEVSYVNQQLYTENQFMKLELLDKTKNTNSIQTEPLNSSIDVAEDMIKRTAEILKEKLNDLNNIDETQERLKKKVAHMVKALDWAFVPPPERKITSSKVFIPLSAVKRRPQLLLKEHERRNFSFEGKQSNRSGPIISSVQEATKNNSAEEASLLQEIVESKSTIEKQAQVIKDLTFNIELLNASSQRSLKEIEDLNSEITHLTDEIKSLEKINTDLLKEVKEKEDVLAEMDDKVQMLRNIEDKHLQNYTELIKSFDETVGNFQLILNQNNNLTNDNTLLERKLEDVNDKNRRLSTEINKAVAETAEMKRTIEKANQRLEELEK